MFLVGEPIIRPNPREEFYVPASQIELCLKVLNKTSNIKEVADRLKAEYLAIIVSLIEIGVNFRIIYAHEKLVDNDVLSVCVNKLGCKLCGFPENFSPTVTAYPRDLSTVLPRLTLINEEAAQVFKNSRQIISSPFGEGGRTLFSDNLIIVCERIFLKEDEKKSRPAEEEDFKPLHSFGIKTATFPAIVGVFYTQNGPTKHYYYNDHIDRGACLIKGKDDKPHLIIDPNIYTAKVQNQTGDFSWFAVPPLIAISVLKEKYENLGITVHAPSRLTIPYSLNLLQLSDLRVLMTTGEPELEKLIGSIVGKENVFVTPIPIEYFPVWQYAGIRCLVSEAPETALIKIKEAF